MIEIEFAPLREMKSHAARIFPDECCGFLYGLEHADGTRSISIERPVENAKAGDKRRRFEITGTDYMRAERFSLENQLQLLGIYHSHPNHPAIPSEHDRIAAQPFFSYVILSVIDGVIDDIRSWRLNDNAQFEEELFSSVHLNPSV